MFGRKVGAVKTVATFIIGVDGKVSIAVVSTLASREGSTTETSQADTTAIPVSTAAPAIAIAM